MLQTEQGGKKEYKRLAYTVRCFVKSDVLTGSIEETNDNTSGGEDKEWGGVF